MSKCSEIRDFLGDYAFEVEYSEDNKFTMFFNSERNARTVKRCIELDDSVPNVATAVDFVEVVRCKNCVHGQRNNFPGHLRGRYICEYHQDYAPLFSSDHYCSYGERRENENPKDTAAL